MRSVACVLLALAVGAIAAESSSSIPAARKHPSQSAATKQDSARDERGTESRPVIVKIQNFPASAPSVEQESKRKEESRWARWITDSGLVAIFTGLQVLVGSVQCWLFIHQLRLMRRSTEDTGAAAKAAKESVDLAQREFVSTHRPWVSIQTRVAGPLIFTEEGGVRLELVHTLKNVGNSPAMCVVDMRCLLSDQEAFFAPKISDLEQIKVRRSAKGDGTGYTLFPGDEVEVPAHHTFHGDTVAALEQVCGEVRVFSANVACYVDYQFAFGEPHHHQTGFVYRLVRVMGGKGVTIHMNVNVPAEELRLLPVFGGRNWAD